MTERRPEDRARVAEALAAGSAADSLREVLVRVQASSLTFDVEGAQMAVPARAASLFVELLEDLSEGRDVTIAPSDIVVGTTEAGRVLGVSRTWVAQLVDDGKLASEVRGTKRRVRLGSLMSRRRSDVARLRRASTSVGETLDAVASEAAARRAMDMATASMWASALMVSGPQPSRLTSERSGYIDALQTAGDGPAPKGSSDYEPALAA